MLLLTGFDLGQRAVAQSVGMDHVRPFTFNALNLLATESLVPVVHWLHRGKTPGNLWREPDGVTVKGAFAAD